MGPSNTERPGEKRQSQQRRVESRDQKGRRKIKRAWSPGKLPRERGTIKWPTGSATWHHWEHDYLSGVVGKEAPLKQADKLEEIKMNE